MFGPIFHARILLRNISKNNLSLSVKRCLIHTSSSILFAQPTPASHAHLLKKGEITPGISSDVYRERRKNLIEKIIKFSRSNVNAAHLVIIPSASIVYMTENVPYPFRQNSDFLYLCGFKEPNSILAIHSVKGEISEHKSILFIPKQTAHSEKWEGCKMDLDTVTDFLDIDKALHVFEFEKFLQDFTKSHKQFTVWYDYLNVTPLPAHQTMRDFMSTYAGSIFMESPRSLLHQIRLIKCDREIELMRKTCSIASKAMREVMLFSHSSNLESHLHAKIDFECRIKGADYLAFPPVVAGGDRGNTIHYIDNNQIILDENLVLMDAGCECHGYSSDMARTWPINGKFTEPQRELYQILLSVHEELIQLCKSRLSLDHLFKIMCKKLGKGLQKLNIIPSTFTEVEASEAAFAFCPHHVSHYLGMDVHDTNTISRGIALQPGMVITVEPGVYISKNNMTVPEKYRGLCIRIEDDILITEDGCEVLTLDCPKHADEIEKLFQNSC